jgi:hypothetical protein
VDISDEVLFLDLPQEHFVCLPDEIQDVLVEHYPHLNKYQDADETISDPEVHEQLAQAAAKQAEMEEKLSRLAQAASKQTEMEGQLSYLIRLTNECIIELREEKKPKPEELFDPSVVESVDTESCTTETCPV